MKTESEIIDQINIQRDGMKYWSEKIACGSEEEKTMALSAYADAFTAFAWLSWVLGINDMGGI